MFTGREKLVSLFSGRFVYLFFLLKKRHREDGKLMEFVLPSELESRFMRVMVQIKAPPQLAQSETQAAMSRTADALVGPCSVCEFMTKPEQFLTSVCCFIGVSSEPVVVLWVGR